MQDFGERIRELRKTQGISQDALALVLNQTKQNISSWENGKSIPRADIIPVLADFFDVSADYLLGRTDHPNLKIIRAPTEYGEVVLEVDRDGPDELTQEELAEVRRILRERRENKKI